MMLGVATSRANARRVNYEDEITTLVTGHETRGRKMETGDSPPSARRTAPRHIFVEHTIWKSAFASVLAIHFSAVSFP